MEAVIHIGVAKTGTTTIQHFCHANRERLLQQGFLYPLCMITPIPAFKDHNLLCSQGIAGLKDRGPALRQEIAGCDCTRLLISAEALQWTFIQEAQIRAFRSFLEQLGCTAARIVLYIRDTNDLFVSMCSQNLKADSTPYYDRLDPRHNQEARVLSDYRSTLQRWGQVFGREQLQVRLFSREAFFEGDLLRDFIHTIGASWDADFTIPPRQNESLNLLEMELLRRINAITDELFGCRHHVYTPHTLKAFIYSFLHKHLALQPTPPQLRFAPPRNIYAAYSAFFASSNEWVRSNFFPDRRTLFPARDLEHYQENYELHSMSREYWDALAMFIVDLAAHKLDSDEQVRQLRAELKMARQLIKRLQSPG